MVNNLNELSAVYLQNIAEQGPEEQQARVTQIVKAVRYRARKEGVELSKAYNDYIGSVQATSTERQAVKEKLGLTGGAAHKEEVEYVGEEEKWIQKAIKKPGALKKQLGVPEDEEIPAGKLKAAAKKGGKLGQRARLAVTLKGLNKEEVEIEESGVGYEAGKPAEKLGAVTGISKKEQDAARERIRAKMAAKSAKKMNEGHYDPMEDPDFDHDEAEENRGVSGKNNPKGGKALGKKKKVVSKEQFSNWREEFIFEVDEAQTDTEEKKQIKDKKVNNKVIINPPMKEAIEELGGTIIEMTEVEEGIGMTMAKAIGDAPTLSKRMKLKRALLQREVEKNIEKNKEKSYSGKAAQEEVDPKQMQQIQRRQLQLDRKKLQLKQQAARQNQSTASDTMISSESVEHVEEGLTDLQRRRYLGRKPGESKERLKRANERKDKKAALAAMEKQYKGMKAGIYSSYEPEGEQLDEMPFQVMGSPDGKKEKKIGKPVKSKKYADARAAELADTHKATGGQYRSQYVEDVEQVDEKLNMKKEKMGNIIKDFYKSDAPQFKGKSKEKRRQMAIAAKLSAERGEN